MLKQKAACRAVAVCLLATMLIAAAAGCYTPRAATKEDLLAGRVPTTEELRLTYPEGSVVLFEDWTLRYPLLEAEVDETKGKVPSEPVAGSTRRSFNVEDALSMEVLAFSRGKTASSITIGSAIGVGIIALIAVAFSCPNVYLHDAAGQHLVGEAYPGAIFGSLRRADWLALPDTAAGRFRITIRNDHDETQFIDRVYVAAVSHLPGEAAIATGDGVLLVDREAPLVAAEANGSDVLHELQITDHTAWQSLPAGHAAADDVIRVTFSAAEPGEYALVVTAENTHWYERAVGDGLRQTGARYDELVAQANRSADAPLARWLADGGVDLVVQSGAREAGRATPFGTAAFRTQAVTRTRVLNPGHVELTLTSGAHYWRIDSLRLVRISSSTPGVEVCSAAAPSCIRMETKGEGVDLDFVLPQQAGLTTSAFLVTSGFYNVHMDGSAPTHADLRPLREIAAELAGRLDLTRPIASAEWRPKRK